MELVRLGVLVVAACLVAGSDEDCKTETVSGHILNLEQSKVQGATVDVLEVFHADSHGSCVSDCCSGRFGSCTIAGFNGQVRAGSVNCYHFRCTPLSACTFLASKETTSFKVHLRDRPKPAGGDQPPGSDSPARLSTQGTTKAPSQKTTGTSESHTERTRTTTARKGVNFTEDGDSGGHVAQGDGTASKPRKGVLADVTPEETAPLKNDNTTVKARKGVELVPQQLENSSVPAADPGDSITAPSVQNTTSTVSSSSPVSTPPSADSGHSALLPGSSPAPAQHQTTSVKPLPPKGSPTVLGHSSGSATPLVPPDLKLGSYAPVQEDPLPVVTGSSGPREPPTTSPGEDSATVTPQPSRPPETQVSQNSPNEEDLKFSMSSMHIVIALVMGLLLLFVVLGIVGKQVYDIWLRRHYHRMDFLIDGMYDSYA